MTDAQVEEIKRHFGVVAEALRSDIRQIAENHSGIRHELQEIRDEFKEMRPDAAFLFTARPTNSHTRNGHFHAQG